MGQVLFDLLNERNSKALPRRRFTATSLVYRRYRDGAWDENRQGQNVKENRRHCRPSDGVRERDRLRADYRLIRRRGSGNEARQRQVVAVQWTKEGAIERVSHRIWQPTPQQPLDLERTG
jgi:hypothetical protein